VNRHRGGHLNSGVTAGSRRPHRACRRGRTQLSTPADVAALLRSPAYLRLLVLAAIIGAPVSALAWGFLALVSKLQAWLFTSLPSALGFVQPPSWWAFPLLFTGGLAVALVIKFLPGTGGHEPADGFKAGGVVAPSQIPGVFLAALATLSAGAVLGPEAPLLALGGGVAAWAVARARRDGGDRAKVVIAAAGSFAALSTLLGSPLAGAFLLMEAAGLGGATMEYVLVPGLLAAGIGTLVFTGLGRWSGLGTFSLGIGRLPHLARPSLAEIGLALAVGLAAAVLAVAIRRFALLLRDAVAPRRLIATPVAGLLVAGFAVLFSQVTGKSTANVLFSGQNQLGPFVSHRASFGLGVLVLLLACKAIAYGISLGCFRGGPIFPAVFIGAAAGVALSHLPGVPAAAGIAIGMGAMIAAVVRLPMTAVLVTALLLFGNGVALLPPIILAAITAYIAVGWLDRPADEDDGRAPGGS
jgi:H+/Cl- antiporter ClcA